MGAVTLSPSWCVSKASAFGRSVGRRPLSHNEVLTRGCGNGAPRLGTPAEFDFATPDGPRWDDVLSRPLWRPLVRSGKKKIGRGDCLSKSEEEGRGASRLRGFVSELRRSVWRGDLIRARGMGRSTKPGGDGGGRGGDSFWGDVEIKHLAFHESGRRRRGAFSPPPLLFLCRP